jgi:glycosyltransferase involved in cell wall biosynthesis
LAQIDILVPHYNDLAGLVRSIESIEAQSIDVDLRVVIADDGSSGDVFRQVEGLAEKHGRAALVLLRSPVNRGRPHTRNALLDAIESDYVAWLDAGDEWHGNKLSAQWAKAQMLSASGDTQPAWITCHYDWQWAGGKPRRVMQMTEGDQIRSLLRGKNLRAYLWTILGHAKSFRDTGWFDEQLPRLQDLDYFIRFVLKGGSLHLPDLGESLCVYHKSDFGRDAQEIRQCNAYLFDKYRVLYNRYGARFRREQLFNMEILSARVSANNREFIASAQFMGKAFLRRPRHFLNRTMRRGFRP